MKKKAIVLALVFGASVLVSASTEAGVRLGNGLGINGVRLGNGMSINGLSLSPTGLDFTTISHHRLGK
jgi:hypothetical protein